MTETAGSMLGKDFDQGDHERFLDDQVSTVQAVAAAVVTVQHEQTWQDH